MTVRLDSGTLLKKCSQSPPKTYPLWDARHPTRGKFGKGVQGKTFTKVLDLSMVFCLEFDIFFNLVNIVSNRRMVDT
jgi:hypothetical protein